MPGQAEILQCLKHFCDGCTETPCSYCKLQILRSIFLKILRRAAFRIQYLIYFIQSWLMGKKSYLHFWRSCESSSKGECILTLQVGLNDDSKDLYIELPHTFMW